MALKDAMGKQTKLPSQKVESKTSAATAKTKPKKGGIAVLPVGKKKKSKKRINITIDPEVHKLMESYAKENGLSVSSLIEQTFKDALGGS